MNITISNTTAYNYDVFSNGQYYGAIGLKNTICISTNSERADITLVSKGKGSSHIQFLAVIFGFFVGDSTTTKIFCDYSFSVYNTGNENVNVVLKYNDWSPREQLDFNTVYAVSENAQIADYSYVMKDYERIAKKHKRLHLFVTSFILPELLLLALCFIFRQEVVILISAIFILLFLLAFTIPSLKEISRFKEATVEPYVNEKLIQYAISRRTGKGKVNEDTSATGKVVNSIMNKLFKLDEDE